MLFAYDFACNKNKLPTVPSVEKIHRKEYNSGNSVSIGNKDMVTHPLQGGCFEQSEQACVAAFIGNTHHKRQQILVAVSSSVHPPDHSHSLSLTNTP